MRVQLIALHHIYVYKPIMIVCICFTYLVSISHTVSLHIICVYSLLKQDSSPLYSLTVCLDLVSIEGFLHVYVTRLLATSHIVN